MIGADYGPGYKGEDRSLAKLKLPESVSHTKLIISFIRV